MIQISHLFKSFDGGASFSVNDVSLTVEDGMTLILLGSSGCGKTTTLKMINRLIEPTRGEIALDGQNILNYDPIELRRSIGYVFQKIGLFPHMNVEENISIILRLKGVSKKEFRKRAWELMELVNLTPSTYAQRYPHQLSGGQQQRVGVARALATNPRYLLMDEPFAALDPINRDALQYELIQLKQRLQKTIVFVTHDLFEALRLGDRIAVMNKGKIEQIGTAKELISHPKTDFVYSLFQKPKEQLAQFVESQ